ncbi:MAG: acyl-ACP--UDP-N-acetylglucosamine O-acyltransferase [Geovibrio sp.]|uniref:acyl-ACP--UDP-N-acetylglucosamine O-acyltransferase n=1 Tax=Geovibrio ferrireducens TaxID=46201 RepID=UPI002247B78D|nr:acyl-ACP--UDP-N-acetylglucosamine O-acyltransferase [Geovibrio ferrireducens]MCD8569211.1 acyl-ACP--UDP-N-acetylglucosamine O-acyltransferase [Geovibrio sp.]
MISPLAYVDPGSEVHETAEIERGAYVGKGCKIGAGVKIGVNAVVEIHTEIGDGTVICANAHVGGAPQDTGFKGEDTKLKIGKNCVIREFATIHRATTKENWITLVGDNCYLMTGSHIAHDSVVGNNVIFTNYSCTAGHVRVGDFTVFGGYAAVHQFTRIGSMVMLGNRASVTKDVPHFCLFADGGIPGLNIVGLRRRGMSSEARLELKKALHIYGNLSNPWESVPSLLKELNQFDEVKMFIDFIEAPSKRGFSRR